MNEGGKVLEGQESLGCGGIHEHGGELSAMVVVSQKYRLIHDAPGGTGQGIDDEPTSHASSRPPARSVAESSTFCHGAAAPAPSCRACGQGNHLPQNATAGASNQGCPQVLPPKSGKSDSSLPAPCTWPRRNLFLSRGSPQDKQMAVEFIDFAGEPIIGLKRLRARQVRKQNLVAQGGSADSCQDT